MRGVLPRGTRVRISAVQPLLKLRLRADGVLDDGFIDQVSGYGVIACVTRSGHTFQGQDGCAGFVGHERCEAAEMLEVGLPFGLVDEPQIRGPQLLARRHDLQPQVEAVRVSRVGVPSAGVVPDHDLPHVLVRGELRPQRGDASDGLLVQRHARGGDVEVSPIDHAQSGGADHDRSADALQPAPQAEALAHRPCLLVEPPRPLQQMLILPIRHRSTLFVHAGQLLAGASARVAPMPTSIPPPVARIVDNRRGEVANH